MKQFLFRFLAFVLILSCAACRNNEQPSSSAKPQETQQEIVPVRLRAGSSFSDGVAWVEYSEQPGIYKMGLVDTNGEIIPVADQIAPILDNPVTNYGSQFSAEYAYFNYEDRSTPNKTLLQFAILNTSGNVVSRSPSDGNYRILTGGDGVFLAERTADGMTNDETAIGIVDQDGNWICEPAAQNELTFPDAIREECRNRNAEIRYAYHGEHIFSVSYDDNGFGTCSRLYHADTGASVEYRDLKLYQDDLTDTPYCFFGGKTVAVSEDMIYCVRSDLSITPLLARRSWDPVIYQNGILFTGECSAGTSTTETGKFYRMDGSVLVDLSQYRLLCDADLPLYRYDANGHAAVLLLRADNSIDLGIIDQNGAFTFTPVTLARNSILMTGALSSDVIFAEIEEKIDGSPVSKQVLLTSAGEKIEMEADGVFMKAPVFVDGFAWCEWYHEDAQYVDTTGHRMNPVLKKR